MGDKNSKKNKENNNSKTNTKDTKTKADLLKDLAAQNQSIALSYIAIITILLNLTHAYNEKANLMNQLQGSTATIDPSVNHRYLITSRKIALFISIVSFKDGLDALNSLLCSSPIDEKAVEAAKRTLIINILVLYAAKLSLYNVLTDANIVRPVPVVEGV